MSVENNQLLRFVTAGSVDNGKSTLIGRLLYDSKSIFEDQLKTIENISHKKGNDKVDLALFTDGLRDEIEQGITIDVAYRYFSTPKRKFIIADTPGHIQYTRNMVTGASMANAVIILIDARHGIVEQTKRHTFIAHLLNISHVIVCINKMDLVDFKEEVFNTILQQFVDFTSKMNIRDIHFIPISALMGDNVVIKSQNMDWYPGEPLLKILETIHIVNDFNKVDLRFPVQTVLRPQSKKHPDFRGYAGRIASGVMCVGDKVTIMPFGFTTNITTIQSAEELLEEAFAPMSISVTLKDDFDVSRGNMIVLPSNVPNITQNIEVMLCWLHTNPAQMKTKYILKHTTNEQKAILTEIIYKIDIQTLRRNFNDYNIRMNDICKVVIRTSKPLMVDSFNVNRITGSIILIDKTTNETVAAGIIS